MLPSMVTYPAKSSFPFPLRMLSVLYANLRGVKILPVEVAGGILMSEELKSNGSTSSLLDKGAGEKLVSTWPLLVVDEESLP
jgi:hypothetical protein